MQDENRKFYKTQIIPYLTVNLKDFRNSLEILLFH
jgi:hypothetical protein